MSPFLWLILKILPVLFVVALLFYYLGTRLKRGGLVHHLAEKDATIEREQQRTDESIRKLKDAEEQLGALQTEYDDFQETYNELLAKYEHLQKGAIPRRLLSEAEDKIIKLQREVDQLSAAKPAPAPAPVQRTVEPIPMESPPEAEPPPEPEVVLTPVPLTKAAKNSRRRK